MDKLVESLNDHCGRCGCERRFHNPPKSEPSHRGHGDKNYQVQIKARTCCSSCPHCICFCIGFVEPFTGQPRERCIYEAADHTHNTPAISNPFTFQNVVPRLQDGVSNNKRTPKTPTGKKVKAPKHRKERRTGRGSYNLYKE